MIVPDKISKEDIFAVLDKKLISQQCGVAIFYHHSYPRGYFVINYNDDSKPHFIGDMYHACKYFNTLVEKEYDDYKADNP